MFYEYICIDKCNRLMKPTIVIRPTKRIQMILGTNGSGKTTLISIGFSPLPADHNDFYKGGSREVHILHKGRRYVLIERFSDKHWYSFSVDGEEKNDGHTITVQLELVKEHFNYTRELHEFITMESLFTDLKPNERRDWIAKMTEADFTYAFREYERYRKGHSAATAVVKFLNGRIADERLRLIEPADAADMREKAAALKVQLRELMSLPRIEGPVISMSELQDEYNALFTGFDQFSRMEYPRLLEGGKSYDDLIDELQGRSTSLKAVQDERSANLSDINQRLERIKGLMAINPEALTQEQLDLKQQLSELPPSRVEIHASMLVRCDEVLRDLRQAIADLPAERITHDRLMAMSERLQVKEVSYNKAETILTGIVERLHQIDRCGTVACPSCQHQFKPGINPQEAADLEERQNKGNRFLKTIGDEVAALADEYRDSSEQYRAFSKLDAIRRQYIQRYPGIFAYLDSVGGFDLGRGLHAKIALYERAVAIQESSNKLVTRIEEIQAVLESFEREGAGFLELQRQRDLLMRGYEEIFEQRALADNDLQQTRRDRQYGQRFMTSYEAVQERIDHWKNSLIRHLDWEAVNLADEEISQLQSRLAFIETALAEDDLVVDRLKDLEAQLAKKVLEQRAYKLMSDALSPKSGEIAAQITLQIGSVVGAVNKVLKRLWNHSFFIRMPSTTTLDLDYKFPIVDENRDRKDISKGSTGMKEAINRAFVIAYYHGRRLKDYPLFLDEPGRTFDETHAQHLIPVIKDLVDSDRYSQVLIISHDADNQRAFPDSQTIIIDDRNINYPYPYNEHVEFELCAN